MANDTIRVRRPDFCPAVFAMVPINEGPLWRGEIIETIRTMIAQLGVRRSDHPYLYLKLSRTFTPLYMSRPKSEEVEKGAGNAE